MKERIEKCGCKYNQCQCIDNKLPIMKERTLYIVTTKKDWFLVPIGRPLTNNKVYVATECHEFPGRYKSRTCYKINNTWYNEEAFSEIIPIKETIRNEPDFILPEKWCVRGINTGHKTYSANQNAERIVIDFLIKHNVPNIGFIKECYYYIIRNELKFQWTLPYNHTEITFEQFKKYVLKENDFVKEGLSLQQNKTEILGNYYSIEQIREKLSKVYDKADVDDIIKTIKK